jgi:hypothetical protein
MRRHVEDPGARGTPQTSPGHDAMLSTAQPARHLGEPRSRTSFVRNEPYVDRTGMTVPARAKRREAPRRRRPPAKTAFSPNKLRPAGAHDPRVRLLLRHTPTKGARGRARPDNRTNGGGR